MKNFVKVLGMTGLVLSIVRILILSFDGYYENITDIAMYVFISLISYLVFLLAHNFETKYERYISEQDIENAIRAEQLDKLRSKFRQWDKELDEEEIAGL